MAIIMAMLILISSSTCFPVSPSNVRCDSAVVYECNDPETGFETSDGHLWGVYGTFEHDAEYVLVFDSLGTEDVTDDIVIGVMQCVK